MDKKILFYLQPQTIRNDPKAFEWIFLKYRDLAVGLSRKSVHSKFLLDDALKLEYQKDNTHLLSPADFGISFDRTDWPVFWADILSDPHSVEKEQLLEAVWDKFNFEVVFCWNYDATLDRFCKDRAITTVYQELGMIRNPLLYQLDFEGLLWKSSLQRLYEKFKASVAVDNARLETFFSVFRAGVSHSREEIVAGLNLDPKKPIVLIPLQVEDDSNIVVGSPFKRMAAFVDFCLNQLKDIDTFNVLIKRHHHQPDLVIPSVDNITSLYSEFGNLSLINAADYIITVNSSMGFEGLCLGKNVLTLGKSPYCGLNFTADLNSDGQYRIADFQDFFAQLHARPADLRRFLYFALFHYQLPERMMFNAHFYGKLFRLLDKTSDSDQVYLADIRWNRMEELGSRGDRYVPWLEDAAVGYEHVHRYAFASQFVKEKRVLDLACGEGYGSCLLAGTARAVVGIDIDSNSIRHANHKYVKSNLQFKTGSMLEVPIPGHRLFDVIVCFGALEYVEDTDKFFGEVKRLLAPRGLFIVSGPNNQSFTDGSRPETPAHLRELKFAEFKALVEGHFTQVRVFGQGIYSNSNIWPVGGSENLSVIEHVVDREPQGFVFVGDEEKVPPGLIAVASDSDAGIAEYGSTLVDVSNELIQQKETKITELGRERERLLSDKENLSRDKENLLGERETLLKYAAELRAALESYQQAALQHGRELAEKDEQLRAAVESREVELNLIYTSFAWKLIQGYRGAKEKLLTPGTRRRRLYEWALAILKGVPIRQRGKVTEASSDDGSDGRSPRAKMRAAAGVIRSLPALFTVRNLGRLIRHLKRYGLAATYRRIRLQLGLRRDAGLTHAQPLVNTADLLADEAVPKEDAAISVVIPTKNGGEDFRRVLAAIANQQGFRALEIVVVDSGSTDHTLLLAEQAGAKIIKILPEEFSHSYARNLGAKHASGDYLLFTVQDALPPSPSWLHELFSVLKNNEVVAVSCAEFPWENADLFYRAISWNHYRFLEVDGQDRIMCQTGADDHVSLRKNGQLSDLACLISKDLFAEYEYKTDYGEDLDLGLRLIKDSHRIGFLGSTRIIHSHHRPAYYYLKRGYVENRFIPRIFPDYPISGSALEPLLTDIGLTYQAVSSIVDGTAEGLEFPCAAGEFAQRVVDKFQAALKATYPTSSEVIDSRFLDREFQDFLSRMIKEKHPGGSRLRLSDGNLGYAVLDFTRMVLRYMEETYELVDECVMEEFRSTLYKTFAYQCGAQLAQCSLRGGEAERAKLERIHAELTRGV